jgi:hypothetical protein
MADLLGGTTGQILAKNSNTDMDFTWTTAAAGGASVNLLLNSNFALNQRAYVSAANLASGSYGFDRWKSNFTNTTLTFTASTQGQSLTINSGGGLQQVIEQGLVVAGTYTLSWTGTATARVYNSGATPPAYAASPVTFTADGTANVVVEFTATGGTRTVSNVMFNYGNNTTWALATPTLQSELAACQRYYYRNVAEQSQGRAPGIGSFTSGTNGFATFIMPVEMRTAPTAIDYNNVVYYDYSSGITVTALAIAANGATRNSLLVTVTVASGGTQFRPAHLSYSATSGFIGVSAEL